MKTVLHIGPNGLRYWRKCKGRWQPVVGAAHGAVWAVTDLAEESLVEIPIPRLFGRDRSNFVARQLANRFPDTPFRAATPQRTGGSLMDRLAPARLLLSGVDAAQRIQSALDAETADLAGVWSSSLLLAQLGQNKRLPSELFVVMPGERSLRIVFLKNRQPVLARLAPVSEPPAEQAAEIVRTLRHLENTRIVERSERRYPVLVLGPTAGLGVALAAQGLDLIAAPQNWQHPSLPDWRFALFDLVVNSPVGQLAPPAARSAFLARRLSHAAYGVASISLSATLWFVSGQLRDTGFAQHEHEKLQSHLGQMQHELAQTEKNISRFGVTPVLLRQVVNLNAQELVSAPALFDSMRVVADLVGRDSGQYVSRFQWQLLTGAQPVCAQAVAARGGVAAPSLSANRDVGHPVELSFDLVLAADSTERSRARTLADISGALTQVSGATLLQDPARNFVHGALTNASGSDAPHVASWCLSLVRVEASSPAAVDTSP
jgi:hypothetical protein